jgi:cation diffusion facilitator CzcD-associated flavoprotein CzcO
MSMTRIVIVGAGFAGIGAALELRAAGHQDIVVYERAGDVGGTWFANTYPGVACDAPSHVYSFSFAQDTEWSRRFAPGAEIQAYLRRCVDEGGIADIIHTGTEVRAATWSHGQWSIELADGSTTSADVFICAVGQLSEPTIPTLPGLSSFGGAAFHTARWRHEVTLADKQVAVVGTGASAIQVIPAIAAQARHLTVYQRSAPYVLKKPDSPYSSRLHRFYQRFPVLRALARRSIWSYLELVTIAYDRWPSALKMLERYHDRILEREIGDPALRQKLRPDFAIGCKRILISNDYHAALARPNVHVVTDRIDEVDSTGISTETGHRRFDAIVFATGFRTTPFISNFTIRGRSGAALADVWAERAGAYLGISVPDFPNMFLMYGPNTNLGSGSIVYMLESQIAHIVDAVGQLGRSPGRTLEVTEAAYQRFLAELDSRQRTSVWVGCRTWYHDRSGRDTHNWPWLTSTYRRRTRRIAAADYRLDWSSALPQPPHCSEMGA